MGNPFFNAIGNSNGQQGGRRNLAPSLLQYIQGYQGNPMQELQNKLNSAGATQEQYDQLHKAAEQIVNQMMGVLGRK